MILLLSTFPISATVGNAPTIISKQLLYTKLAYHVFSIFTRSIQKLMVGRCLHIRIKETDFYCWCSFDRDVQTHLLLCYLIFTTHSGHEIMNFQTRLQSPFCYKLCWNKNKNKAKHELLRKQWIISYSVWINSGEFFSLMKVYLSYC